MAKVLLYFVDFETRIKLPPEEWEVDENDEFDVFTFNAFLAKIGIRSMTPFVRKDKKMWLTHIVSEPAKGPAKMLFWNAQNL